MHCTHFRWVMEVTRLKPALQGGEDVNSTTSVRKQWRSTDRTTLTYANGLATLTYAYARTTPTNANDLAKRPTELSVSSNLPN